LRVRLFPRILPPQLSCLFWLTVLAIVFAIWGGRAWHALFHGDTGFVVAHLAELKGLFVLIVFVIGGSLRLAKKAATRRTPSQPSDPNDPASRGIGGSARHISEPPQVAWPPPPKP
jgi:hypothetical protein